MANIFKPKRSSTSSSVPTTGDLTDGELAVNSADKIIYLRDGGSIVEVANYSTGTNWVSNGVGIHTLSNVGIGSTQPKATLDVDGSLNVSGVSTFQGNVNLGDNDKLQFGDGIDLQIFSDGSTSYIQETNASSALWIKSNSTEIRTGGNQPIAKFIDNAGVELYYALGDKKFETTGIGATVFGTLETQQLNVSGVSTFQGDTNVTGNLTVDTNTLFVNSANNRIGIGTTNPAYQVEIENTGANALLVLDRTDGAACFIEGQATRSAFGSVNATPLALAYNSAAVVLVGASGSITVNPDGDGFTFPTIDGSANQVLQTDGEGNLSFADSVTATEHKILDDISSSFNGSTTQFTISSSSTNFLNSEITTAARLLISVGGVVQQPDPTQTNGFYISGGTDLSTDPIKINFVEAPKAGQVFFGVAFGLTTSPTSSFVTSEEAIAYSIVFGV